MPAKHILTSVTTKAPEGTATSLTQNLTSDKKLPNTRRKAIDRRGSDSTAPKAESENLGEDRRTKGNRRGFSERGSAEEGAEGKTGKEPLSEFEKLRQQNEIRVQQHRKKKLLAGCEPVMGMNYDTLAMDDYPDNALVAAARRDRDYWIFLCSLFGSSFVLGLLGFVPAWVSGIGSGLCLASILFACTSIRSSFFVRPPLSELLQKRKAIEFSALNHIQFLEGKTGLAWRCGKMSKYNSNLNRKLFKGLMHYSLERTLLNVVKNKKHIRLYLLLMIESQKAYKRLQNDYLQSHFANLDQGWDDSIDDAEAAQLGAQADSE